MVQLMPLPSRHLAPVKSRMVYLSGAGLPRLSWKKPTDVVVVVVVIYTNKPNTYLTESSRNIGKLAAER